MKKIMTLAVTMLLSIAAYAADYGTYYQNMPVKMQQPEVAVIPDYSVNLKDFGAVGDGITLNTQAFDKAIKALDKKVAATSLSLLAYGSQASSRSKATSTSISRKMLLSWPLPTAHSISKSPTE